MRLRSLLVGLILAILALPASASAAQNFEWLDGFRSPGTPAKYNKVGVLKVGPKSAKNILVLNPGTSASAAYFAPLANGHRAQGEGLAGVGGRAPGEPARGPLGAQPREDGPHHGAAAVRLLPRLAHRLEHHEPLPVHPGRGCRLRAPVGNARGDRGPAARGEVGTAGRRARGGGRALARRLDHLGVRHLGLRRQARRARALGPRVHRRRQQPHADLARRRRAGAAATSRPRRRPGSPSAASRRRTPASSTPPAPRA